MKKGKGTQTRQTGNPRPRVRRDEGLTHTSASPPSPELEYPTLQAAATVPMRRRRRQHPTAPFVTRPSRPRDFVPSSTGKDLASSGSIESCPNGPRVGNPRVTGIDSRTGMLELDLMPEEADPLRFRSASEPLKSPKATKPISITFGSIDYLVSPREMIPHQLESRTEYANRQFDSNSKKSLNVDSPSFTPAQLTAGKKSTFSTNATPFTPRGAASCKKTPFPFISMTS